MDFTNYITQDIPNMEGVFSDISQKVLITDIQVNWKRINNPTYESQIVVGYEIYKEKDGVNVSSELKTSVRPKVFTNNTIMYQRSFEESTLFQPLPNPNYINPETLEEGQILPENNEPYLTMGGFDFIVGELVHKHPEYLIPFLKLYILDNYDDGWYNQ